MLICSDVNVNDLWSYTYRESAVR